MKQTLVVSFLTIALSLGVFADLAVRDVPVGLSMFLWICALVGAVAFLARRANTDLAAEWKTMAWVTVALAVTLLWRSSGALTSLALLGAGGTLILTTLRGAKPRLAECGLLEYCHGALVAGAHATAGLPILLFSDLRRSDGNARKGSRRLLEVVRGVAITVPVVLVIGALFVGADAVFENMVHSIFDIDLSEVMGHLFMTGFIAWIVAGFFRGTFLAKPTPFPYTATKPLTLGITEVSIVLGSSILLFSLFLAVQFRYFFGGAGLVQITPSLTYAEYARRGFFELTAVVALVLPLLLILDWMLPKENPARVRLFRVLATVQVVFLFAVIGSAVQRMLLYQQEYGLTELRLYTTAFMAWLALVLAWYVLTVLTGRRSRFAIGAVGAGLLVFFVLLALNPDDLIARTNISRVAEGKPMDARYLARLGNDAVPALMDRFSTLDDSTRAALAAPLLKRKERLAGRDWRSWNWSSYAALRAMAEREEELRAAAASGQ